MSTTASNKTKVLICPYCGDTQAASERCRTCGGLFEPLSRQASHNAMGPWFVRDERRPFQPGASYETIVKLAERGQIDKYSIIRGPTTKQFWTVARRVPGISHLLGYCHNCDANVGKDDHGCPVCGVPFGAYLDRNYLGLPEVRPLPWEAPSIDNGRGNAAPTFTPMPPASAGGADFRRAAEPLGLSSFASDAELRGMAARQAAAAMNESASGGDQLLASGVSAVADVPHDSSRDGHAVPSSSRAAILDGSPASIAARSMQRRLQRQQGTIRLLMALVGIVTVGSIVVIAVLITRFSRVQSAESPSPSSSQQQSTATGQNRKSSAQASDSVSGQATDESGEPVLSAEPEQAVSTASASATETGGAADGEPAVQPAVNTAGSIQGDHERAVALVAEAKKEDRPIKDRIRDCEEAVGLLKGIKSRAAPNEKPDGLDEQIVEADRLLERLKLKEFFP